MSSDKKTRKEFQSRLGDFQSAVPVDGWDRIEASLDAIALAKRTALRRRLRYIGSAAAVMILLLGSLLFLKNQINSSEPTLSDALSVSSLSDSTYPALSSEVVTEPDQGSELFSEQSVAVDKISPSQPSSKLNILEELSQSESELLVETINVDERKTDTVVDEVKFTEEEIDKEADYDKYREELLAIAGGEDLLFAESYSVEKRDKMMLSISGGGMLTSYNQTINSPMTLRSTAYAADDELPEELGKVVQSNSTPVVSEAKMEHVQPVSFGITFSKSVIDNLYIETGLVYSYLYSKTKNRSDFSHEQETQKFHYFGIPLYLNWNIVSINRFNLFTSVGGMVEKDLYGEYRSVKKGQSGEYINSSEEYETTKLKQRHPQFSVNAGVGFSYPIYNDLRLYGKIGGAYYFNANNLHKTIYSDRKIAMDMNFGLRYEF